MTHLLKPSLLAFALALHACNSIGTPEAPGGGPGKQPGKPPAQASEVDPGMALAGITLLAGTLTVLRVRRKK